MTAGRGRALLNVHNVRTHYRDGLFGELARRWRQTVIFFLPAGADLSGRLASPPPYAARQLDGPPLRRWLALAAALRRAPCDVLLMTFDGRVELGLAWLAARLRRVPLVLWHGLWDPPRTLLHRLIQPLAEALLRAADAVLTYGDHTRRTLVWQGVDPRRIVVCPQTVDNRTYGRRISAGRLRPLRRRLRRDGRRAALFVGRIEAEKGLEHLLRAMQLPAARGWRLTLAGSGPLAAELGRRTGAGAPLLLGQRAADELAELYAAADALILPSVTTPTFREPWGLVVNEAMNQGLPVVVSDAVGAAGGGLVEHGVTGLVVPERDPMALAAALGRLADEPGLAARLGGAGRRRVAAWTYPRMADRVDRAIALARQAGSPPPARRGPALVSFSFDDGSAEDLRVARLLRAYGLRATFYVPLANPERAVLAPGGVRALAALGHEVASHGVSHRRLHALSETQTRRELFRSRQALETVLGSPVEGFAFPGGKFHPRQALWAAQAGYEYCRTVAMFRSSGLRERNLLHTTLQLHPHGALPIARNVLKRRRMASVAEAAGCWLRTGLRLEDLVRDRLDRARRTGGALHLWGHSWEIARGLGWRRFETLLRLVAGRRGVRYVTNRELFDALVPS